MSFTNQFMLETAIIAQNIDQDPIEKMAEVLHSLKGRLFILGVGGSAANASHAVNDFRKICGIEAYTPTDNVAELTARTNDNGWDSTFMDWLNVSYLNKHDMILVLSVNGGTDITSPNIVKAIKYAKAAGCEVLGIVGRSDSFTNREADLCIVVPNVNEERVTPHAEAWQSIILHLLVSHPLLRRKNAQ